MSAIDDPDVDLVITAARGHMVVSNAFRKIVNRQGGVVETYCAPPEWTLDQRADSLIALLHQGIIDDEEDQKSLAAAVAWVELRRVRHAAAQARLS